MYYVYAIGFLSCIEQQDYNNCYIGVTNNLDNRWNGHSKSKYTVGKAIREHGWTRKDNMVVLFQGSEEVCFDKEVVFRPFALIGLNEAAGGRGGFTAYSKSRAEKIAAAHKGKKKTLAHRAALSKSRIEQKTAQGERNPKAKTWELVDSSGKGYIIKGRLESFCKEHNILPTVLIRYRGASVPPASRKSRSVDLEHFNKRINTIGWILK